MLRINYHSNEWEQLEKLLERDLLDCYKQLAKLGVSMEETCEYRGRAAYITKLLNLKNVPAMPANQGE